MNVVNFLGDGVFLGENFFGAISVRGVCSFIRDGGGVCISETDRELGGDVVRDTGGVFEGDGGVDGSSPSMAMGLTLGESLMTLGSS